MAKNEETNTKRTSSGPEGPSDFRADTAVVEAPIRYPTDSRLCEDGVRVLRRELDRLLKSGVERSASSSDASVAA
jgi:hypothetical protein